jgi:tripartite motif-containing protein 59
MLKQRPLPEAQPVEIYPRVSNVIREEWTRTKLGRIKKAVIPEMRVSSKRMPCFWSDNDEKEMELFKILNIPIVSLISVVLMLILFLNHHIITFLNEITSIRFSEDFIDR